MKVRCIDASGLAEGFLVSGSLYEVRVAGNGRQVSVKGGDGAYRGIWASARFELAPASETQDAAGVVHDKALLNLAFPCPKVDPYAEHRKHEEEVYSQVQRENDQLSGATARLHAGLESEKVRERVKAFPHPARNPR